MRPASRKRSKAILVFGESGYDAQALKQIVLAARTDIPLALALDRPPTLRRSTDISKHRKRADIVIGLVKAALVKHDIHAVVMHRDLDQIEPADDPVISSPDEAAHCRELQNLKTIGVTLIATAPAWEMETWWLMWPEQVAKVRPGWRLLRNRTHVRVDKISNSKELLRQELRRPDRPHLPDYSETDAPRIATKIREDKVVRSPHGKSVAFERLILALDQLVVV